ncbi:hypothetical protein LSUE1_G006779, partial [Lachnellula suecica]
MVLYPHESNNNDLNLVLKRRKQDNDFGSKGEKSVGTQRLRWKTHTLTASGAPSHFSINSVDPLHFLPIAPSVQNGELFNIFIKLLTKFVVSIDGDPPANYYNTHWVPRCVKSPLLAQLAIYTASCYQAEFQKIPAGQSTVALGLKLKSIAMLNDMLRSEEQSTCDETICGVVYLITNEWYWGIKENVEAHLRGLRQIVSLRGGLEEDMNPFLRQMIVLCDYHTACSYDCELIFPHNVDQGVPHPIHIGTPLWDSKDRFSDQPEKLHISQETAMILDDMRFLTSSIIKLGQLDPVERDLTKLMTTSKWIRDRIYALPSGNDCSKKDPRVFIYRSCRIAALIYCKAIVERIPLSQACTKEDLKTLWGSMWRVTLTQWKSIPGIFIWIILSAHQAARDTAYGRFLKSVLKTASFYIALENWCVVDGALWTFVELQRWLRKGTTGTLGCN